MPHAQRSDKLFLALCGNAVLLGLIALSLWKGGTPAVAQAAPATVPGGLTIMPAQLAPQVYGCYLMDADRQALCVYSYKPGEHDLHLEAARDVEFDRLLKLYNTSPPPTQVQQLAAMAAQPARAAPPAAK